MSHRILLLILWMGITVSPELICAPESNARQSKILPKRVTVWIHGTKLTPTSFWRSFFYRIEGMQPVTKYESKYHLRKIAETFALSDPEYSLDDFYVFGWSGRLNFRERLAAAQTLYAELEQLNHSYTKKYGVAPVFTIITHSHGGNVALNLVRAKNAKNVEKLKTSVSVDLLVLLACPVQDETKHCIADETFKKVISFYSSSDLLQVIDPQGIYSNESKASSLFSGRIFPAHDKLLQIKTTKTKRGLMHIEFLSLKFIQQLSPCLRKLSELLIKNPLTQTCVLELTTDRSFFRKPYNQQPPFLLSIA